MDNNTLKRRSQQGALISAVGFGLALLAFIYASTRLYELKNEINKSSDKLKSIDLKIKEQDSFIKVQHNIIDRNQILIDTLVYQLNRLTDKRIHPKAQAVLIPGSLDNNGRQIYDFTIWITSSQVNLNRIKIVKYKFDHDSYLLKERQSSNVTNGFLVSYRGWGCLELVEISIEYNDGTSENAYFNMCKELQK